MRVKKEVEGRGEGAAMKEALKTFWCYFLAMKGEYTVYIAYLYSAGNMLRTYRSKLLFNKPSRSNNNHRIMIIEVSNSQGNALYADLSHGRGPHHNKEVNALIQTQIWFYNKQ